MDDVIIRHIKLPYSTYALTSVDSNGDYNVYVNTEICPEKQKAALNHELSHISHNHFYDDKSISEDESEADDLDFDSSILPYLQWG